MKGLKKCLLNALISGALLGIGCNALAHSTMDKIYLQKAIAEDINAYRLKQDLPPLQVNAALSLEAQQHSQDMAAGTVPFGHQGFNDRAKHAFANIPHASGFAENVAYTSQDARTVVGQWLHSRGHRKNIEGNYQLTGIGLAYNQKDIVYVTQVFLGLKS